MIQQTLFGETDTGRPLASRMRPRTLEEFAGQRHLLGEGKVLRQLIDRDRVPSMIFWGPPGVGKTTLARIIADTDPGQFHRFQRRDQRHQRDPRGHADAPRRTAASAKRPSYSSTRFTASTRRSRMRFCPFVEKGSIILIGATTENPSFEINSALLSRCKVFVLQALSAGDLRTLLRRALTDPRGFGGKRWRWPRTCWR